MCVVHSLTVPLRDFLGFFFCATGGLDSLLDPQGSIKKAHQKAANAFGAQHTYFVTNGTSTANKIVCQALMAPGDIVLIDRDCHKVWVSCRSLSLASVMDSCVCWRSVSVR